MKQERAVLTRAQIVEGAARRFERSGYGSTSLADIAVSAGVTKGALYFHFKSKDELAQEVIDEEHRRALKAIEKVAEHGAPGLEQVVMLCHEMARLIVTDAIVRAGTRLTIELGAFRGTRRPYQDWIDTATRLLGSAVEQGDVRDDVPIDALARFIVASFTGVQLVSDVLDGRAYLSQRVEEMWALLLPAVVPSRRRPFLRELGQSRLPVI